MPTIDSFEPTQTASDLILELRPFDMLENRRGTTGAAPLRAGLEADDDGDGDGNGNGGPGPAPTPGLDLRVLADEESDPEDPIHPTWDILFTVLEEKAVELQGSTGSFTDVELVGRLSAFLDTLLTHRERYVASLADETEDLTADAALAVLRRKLVAPNAAVDFRSLAEDDLSAAFRAMLKGAYGRDVSRIDDIGQGGEDIDPFRLERIAVLDGMFEWANRNLADLLTRVFQYSDAESLLQALIGSVESLGLDWRFQIIGLWMRKVSHKGDRDFLNQRPEDARAEFARVAVIEEDGTVLPGPEVAALSAYYDDPKTKIANILAARQDDDGGLLDDDGENRFGFSAQAVSAIQLIAARLALVNGGIEPVAPIWRFDYLYQLSTFFAQQAQQAEQRYIQFEERRSSSSITRQQLIDAVSAARNELSIAEQRIREQQSAVDVARERVRMAADRREGLSEEYWEYISSSSSAIQYQAIAASLGGGSSGVFSDINHHIERIRRTGQTYGERGLLIGASTYLAGMEMRDVELQRMRNARNLAENEENLARKQLKQERTRLESAQRLRSAVRSRYDEARALAQRYQDQDLTPEAYNRLAQLMKRVSAGYLNMAYEVSYLAEQGFNYEFRSALSVITAPDSTSSPTDGLLQSEILRNQLASFKLSEVYLGGEERSIVTWELKPHELFPASYFDAINNKKPFTFVLDYSILDKKFPGLVDVRIENLLVKVTNGRSIRLTNGFFAQIRGKKPNDIISRVQNATDSIDSAKSSVMERTQAALQDQDARKRRPFEDTSPFCAWSLELIDDREPTRTITTLVFTLSGTFSQEVFDDVMASRQTEERVLPIALDDLDATATESLRAGNTLRVSLPFSIPSDDGGDPIQLFPAEEGIFPLLTGVQAVVGLSDSAASPTSLSAKITLPYSGAQLAPRTLEAEGGVAWPDEDIPDDQPAVGDYEISLEGANLDKLNGAALLLRYKITALRDGYTNRLVERAVIGSEVKLKFSRGLLAGTWKVILNGDELGQVIVSGDSTRLVWVELSRIPSGSDWADAVFRNTDLAIDLSLRI